MQYSRFIVTCGAAISVATLFSAEKKQLPNIVLIIADDLGYTDLGCYGSTFYETPAIDKLVSEGIKFTNGYAASPVSSSSRAAIFTGKYPVSTGVTDWIPGRSVYSNGKKEDRFLGVKTKQELALEETTIAEALKSRGYKTMFAGKWHLGETEQFWPENQGWDFNLGGWSAGRPNLGKKGDEECGGYFSPYCNPRLTDGPKGEYLPERLVGECCKFIDKSKGSPFFVTMSFYLVHGPLQAKPEVVSKYKKKLQQVGLDKINPFAESQPWMLSASGGKSEYKERTIQSNPVFAAMVEALDENIGRLIDHLKKTGEYENTLIIFTSDNGGLSTAEGSPTSNRPLRGGKGWLYEGGIREPFLIIPPGKQKKAQTCDLPVGGIDIFPTIMTFAGGRTSEYPQVEGIDILQGMKKGTIKDRPLFWHYPHYSNQGGSPASAIRVGDYKLIHDIENEKWQLYDLKNDWWESTDLSAKEPKIREKLKGLLIQWRKNKNAKMPKPNPNWNGCDTLLTKNV